MVTITIFIEGGVVPHTNDATSTINGSSRLREAFHKLLNGVINNESFRLIVELSGGWKPTVTHFKNQYSPNTLLLIDLDGAEETKNSKLDEFDLEGYETSSFFMVQKMEAWILSQIETVDSYFSSNFLRKDTIALTNDESILNKAPQSFRHPDFVLKTILAKHFVVIKNGKEKKLEYGKLKHAPLLLEILDIQKLRSDFVDVANLIAKILAS